jgi:hypothetical protein
MIAYSSYHLFSIIQYKLKKISYILFAFIAIISLNSCEDKVEALDTNYVTFGATAYSTGVDVGGSSTFEIPVFTANVTGSTRTIMVAVDPASNAAAGSYTVPTSVTIAAGENKATLSVVLTDTNLGIGVNKLTLNFGNEIGLSTGAATTISYIQNCTEVTATLAFNFDTYAEETGWSITDALGGVVASKAAASYTRNQGTATETIVLCAGRDYTLTVTDVYADGMDDGATLGSYTLTIGGTTKVSGGGAFGASEATAFDTK